MARNPGMVLEVGQELFHAHEGTAQRRVVELAYFEGLTCREVASAMGIPEGTAKSRLRLAMAKLETALDRQLLEST